MTQDRRLGIRDFPGRMYPKWPKRTLNSTTARFVSPAAAAHRCTCISLNPCVSHHIQLCFLTASLVLELILILEDLEVWW